MPKELTNLILIAHKDNKQLPLLSSLLGKYYEIKAFTNSYEAVQALEQGLKPRVIISDETLPDIEGALFLEKSSQLLPQAPRILIVEGKDNKELINSLKISQAYMFLKRPLDEIELVQAVRNASNLYRLKSKNKELTLDINELERKNLDTGKKFAGIFKESKDTLNQAIVSIYNTTKANERFYFNSHSDSVVDISKSIAEELGWKGIEPDKLQLAAQLHGLSYVGMPDRFLLHGPVNLKGKELNLYFEYFQEALGRFANIKLLVPALRIAAQIWERMDGSGMPKNLTAKDISREAKIIGAANLYHNSAFMIKPNKYQSFIERGLVVQSTLETKKRQDEALKFFFKKSNWYDMRIINAFHQVIKKRKLPLLGMPKKDLILDARTGGEASANKNSNRTVIKAS